MVPMPVRKLAFLAVAVVVSFACGGTPAPATGSTIIIGAPPGTTGSLALEGKLTKQGYDLWQDWINQSPR